MQWTYFVAGLAFWCLASVAHAQYGENIEGRDLCNQAVALEQQRQEAGKDPKQDLTTYCFDMPDSEIEDIDWNCILKTMKNDDQSLSAAVEACGGEWNLNKQPTDIVDEAFAPIDKAFETINEDLNK